LINTGNITKSNVKTTTIKAYRKWRHGILFIWREKWL